MLALSQEFTTLVSIASGIAAIIACIKLVNTPLDKIKQNSEDIKELKEHQKKRNEMDRAILNGLQAMTNHMIDGNGIERLKASRDELNHAISEIATK